MLTATYVDTYRKGWDAIRSERLARMKQLGMVSVDLARSPRGPIDRINVAQRLGSMTEDGNNPPWNDLPADRREDLAYRRAVYAAMVDQMDQNIGRLVASLEAAGEFENTLILFTSDNGACACAEWEPFGFDLAPDAYRNNKPGYGIHNGTPGRPNVLHRGEALKTMGGPGSLFSYGSGWANASNTPLSCYKHYAHEGGIRSPMIAPWPKRIIDGGAVKTDVGHVMNIMATAVEIADAE